METIALVGARLEREKGLFELLKVIFPECKILIIPSDVEGDGDIRVAQQVAKRERRECRSS